jgi:hypothetical protein
VVKGWRRKGGLPLAKPVEPMPATACRSGEPVPKADCLDCHAHAKEGDLLGAFTYYLNAPVEKLNVRE